MRILVFDNTQMIIRGNSLFCAEGTGAFVHELHSYGHQVTMFGQMVHDSNSSSSFDIQKAGVFTAGLTAKKGGRVINYLLLYLKATVYILKSDFAYFFYPTSYKYLGFVCSLFRKKFGLYIRGDEGFRDYVSKALYRRATAVFTVASLYTDYVNSINPNNIGHTIRPMISYVEDDIILDRHYSQKNTYNILFLCRIEKTKGIVELLNAVNVIEKNNHDKVKLTVVGAGDYFDKAKDVANSLKLNSIVSFYGNVNDEDRKRQFFLESDIYILPTYYKEGFPRTLYEAMIFGTPIITTFVSGIPSLMVDRKNCYRIETKSVDSIVESIEFAINNYEVMAQYARNATLTVKDVIRKDRLSHAGDVNSIISNL